MLQAGKLTQRIKLQTLQVTKGASGGMAKAWTEVATVWASLRHLDGHTRQVSQAGGGEAAQARTEITIRHRAGMDASTTRVLYGATVYTIQHVNDWQERHEFIVLTCDTGVRNA